MADRGRPTLYSKELEKEICIHALEGMSMRQIAKLPGMPSFRTLLRWTKRYPGFQADAARVSLDWIQRCGHRQI